MLLESFVVLNGFGFVAWILGSVLGYREAAAIGAVVITGAGAMVVASGLEYRSGQVRDHDLATVNNTTVTQSVTVQNTYTEVSLVQQYGIGFLVLMLGGSGLLHALDPES